MAVPRKPKSINVKTMELKDKKKKILDPTVFNFMDKVKKIKKRKSALDDIMKGS